MTTNSDRRRPGRPPGTSDTRDRILASARELFSRNGIDNTSIRAIASDAGVDPALVHHYFGTKTQLFAAAIHIPIDPMTILGPIREVPVDQIGRLLPSLLLPLYDSELGKGFIATLRSVIAGSNVADISMLRSFLQEVITAEVGRRVDDPPGSGPVRAQFVASQLLGIVMARYILELEPFRSLPVQQIIDTVAPNLQRYLTGELPSSLRTDPPPAVAGVRRRRLRRLPRREAPNTVVDAVLAPKTRVVKRVLREDQRSAVIRAHQDGEQGVVQRHPAQRPGVWKIGESCCIGFPGPHPGLMAEWGLSGAATTGAPPGACTPWRANCLR